MNSAPAFQPYGPPHLVVLAFTVSLPFILAAMAHRSQTAEKISVAALSIVLVGNYAAFLLLVHQFGAVNWLQVLPMQLCDWAMVVIIIALCTHRPRWFEVAYFWGLGGTLQAVLTPNLAFGFPDFRFFSFFISHCGVIVGVGFLMLRYRLRPYPVSIVRVFAWSELYFLVTLTTDHLTGVNYGFLLHKPEAKTLLNLLSDYRPLYLFQMHLLALGFFAALYLPFALADLLKASVKTRARKLNAT